MDKNERRQQLLFAARDCFARLGYHNTTIDDIVTAAGVARGTYYLYFTDKRKCFEEVVDRAFARIGMVILRVDPQDGVRSVEDQIRENVRRIVGTLLEDRATTKILLADAVGVDPDFDRKLLSFYEEVGRLLEEALTDGQALGVVAEGDPRLLAFLIVGTLKEILYQVILRGLRYEEEAITEAIYRAFSQGFLRA
jgi:AcrR family transcriptional regulator